MSTTPLDTLRQINRRLAAGLAYVESGQQDADQVLSDRLTDLLSDLLLGGDCLPAMASDPIAGAGHEISAYREHLLRLQHLLPDVHARLLTRKASLEAERQRLRALTAWAEAQHSTT
jgi:hypothetical protein